MKEVIFQRKNPYNGLLEQTGSMTMTTNGKHSVMKIYGDIVMEQWESWWFGGACPQDVMDFTEGLEEQDALDIYVNSGGGVVTAGMAIYDIVRRCKGKTTAYVDGIAASIASVIVLGADETVMHGHDQIMIHRPWSSMWGGTAQDFRNTAQMLDSCEDAILDIYLNHAKEGVTEQQIRDAMAAETWMTGKKAAEMFNIRLETGGTPMNWAPGCYGAYKNAPQPVRNHMQKEKEAEKQQQQALLQAQLDLLEL